MVKLRRHWVCISFASCVHKKNTKDDCNQNLVLFEGPPCFVAKFPGRIGSCISLWQYSCTFRWGIWWGSSPGLGELGPFSLRGFLQSEVTVRSKAVGGTTDSLFFRELSTVTPVCQLALNKCPRFQKKQGCYQVFLKYMHGWLVIHNHFFANTADISHKNSMSEMGVLLEFPILWKGVPERFFLAAGVVGLPMSVTELQ